MDKIIWHTEKRKILELIPYKGNPRQLTEQQAKDLTKSLEKFNLAEIPAINSNNKILAGNQRVKILQLLGRGEEIIDVRMPSRELSLEEESEYLIRSNKNTGEWDFDALASFDENLLKDCGFDSTELDRIFDMSLTEDDFDSEKEYESITEPFVKYGDIYQLGEDRLMCADAAKEEDVALLMNGSLARMIFTDPPYNVDYKSPGGLTYNSTKFGGTGGKIFNDDKTDEECIKFYTDVLKNLFKFSTPDVTIYWWFANKNNWINRLAFENSGWHMSQIIIWLKNSMVFSRGQDYHRQYEPCMVGWKKKQAHYKNKKISDLKDVFNLDFDDFQEMLDVWYQHRDVTSKYLAPTQKPVRLSERALKKNSERGDIVLDLFGGSGSTLIGCQQLERKCYLMELDPKYAQVCLKRWELFIGKKGVKIN